MMDNLSAQIFKKQALDRWENEGGMFCAEQTENARNDTETMRFTTAKTGRQSGRKNSQQYDFRRYDERRGGKF